MKESVWAKKPTPRKIADLKEMSEKLTRLKEALAEVQSDIGEDVYYERESSLELLFDEIYLEWEVERLEAEIAEIRRNDAIIDEIEARLNRGRHGRRYRR